MMRVSKLLRHETVMMMMARHVLSSTMETTLMWNLASLRMMSEPGITALILFQMTAAATKSHLGKSIRTYITTSNKITKQL